MPLIPNLSLYPVQKIDRLALWGNLTILELHFAETQGQCEYLMKAYSVAKRKKRPRNRRFQKIIFRLVFL